MKGSRPPAVIGKHVDYVRSQHNVEVVYVRHAVTSYNRKRLIEVGDGVISLAPRPS